MSDQILNILKLFLLALLWLFFLRVLRSVWVEIRSGDAPEPAPDPGNVASRPGAVPAAGGGRRTAEASKAPSRLLIVEPAELAGRSFTVSGELSIGRSGAADISLPADSYVSSDHARVYRSDGRLWVEDRGSTNGTTVNSRRIAAATPLQPGDRLQVGRTVLEVAP